MPAKFNLMTDSPCDFTQQMVEDSGIRCLHFSYTEAGREGGLSGEDDLFQSRDPHSFYEEIRKGACPMTSQPSQLEFERAFREAAELELPTVYLCFSSGISGCYEGAQTPQPAHQHRRPQAGIDGAVPLRGRGDPPA